MLRSVWMPFLLKWRYNNNWFNPFKFIIGQKKPSSWESEKCRYSNSREITSFLQVSHWDRFSTEFLGIEFWKGWDKIQDWGILLLFARSKVLSLTATKRAMNEKFDHQRTRERLVNRFHTAPGEMMVVDLSLVEAPSFTRGAGREDGRADGRISLRVDCALASATSCSKNLGPNSSGCLGCHLQSFFLRCLV